jgi:hypothetical protein
VPDAESVGLSEGSITHDSSSPCSQLSDASDVGLWL